MVQKSNLRKSYYSKAHNYLDAPLVVGETGLPGSPYDWAMWVAFEYFSALSC